MPLPANTVERRTLIDRRARPTRLGSAFFHKRRTRCRRRGEQQAQYLDQVSRSVSGLAILVIALSAIDALCTLIHLQNGAIEANPVMAIALLYGVEVFLVAKGGLTLLGVVLLAVHENFRCSAVGLRCLAVGYLTLTLYHVALLLHLGE